MNNQQALANREQLKAKISANSRKLEPLFTRRYQLQSERLDAKNRAEGLSRSAESNPARQREADAEKQRFERLSADLEKVQAQIEDLQRDIDADNAALEAFNIKVGGGEIISLQNAIKAILQKDDNTKRLIAEQQTIIDIASQTTDTTTELKKRRCVLLAESATGVDHGRALAAIDADIANAKQSDLAINQANAIAADKARETIAGLNAMQASHLQDIIQKQHSLGLMHDTLLGQMAAEELDNYKAAVQHLVDSLRNLAAIDSLIAKIGIRRTAGILPGLTNQKITLPALGDMPGINISGVYMSTFNVSAEPANCENLFNRLAEQGIEV